MLCPPTSSLFVEARKKGGATDAEAGKNYNRYGGSLMKDPAFHRKARLVTELAKVLDTEDDEESA